MSEQSLTAWNKNFLLLLLLSSAGIFAQQADTSFYITGRVVDHHWQPLKGALVRLDSTGHETETDSAGRFLLTENSPNSPVRRPVQQRPGAGNPFLLFSLGSPGPVTYVIFGLDGKRLFEGSLNITRPGQYRLRVPGLFPATSRPGVYAVKVTAGGLSHGCRLALLSPGPSSAGVLTRLSNTGASGHLAKSSSATILRCPKISSVPVKTSMPSSAG